MIFFVISEKYQYHFYFAIKYNSQFITQIQIKQYFLKQLSPIFNIYL